MRDLRNDLIDLGQYIMSRGLAWGNSGNMSARKNADKMIITASGTYMGDLGADDLVEVDIESGAWDGKFKPSKEIPMHAAIYQERPEAGAVIHSSPFWSTLAACSGLEVLSGLFIESMYYLENVAFVDYYHPGSRELGEAVREKTKEADVIFLQNHGILVFDENIREARMRLETVEMTCRMLATARSCHVQLRELSPDAVSFFLNHSGYKPRKKADEGKR